MKTHENKVNLVTFIAFLFLLYISLSLCSTNSDNKTRISISSYLSFDNTAIKTSSNSETVGVEHHLHRDARRLSPPSSTKATSSEEDDEEDEDDDQLFLRPRRRKRPSLKYRLREKNQLSKFKEKSKAEEDEDYVKKPLTTATLFQKEKLGSNAEYNLELLALQNDRLVQQLLEKDKKKKAKKKLDFRGLGLPYPESETSMSSYGDLINQHESSSSNYNGYAIDPASPAVLAHTQHNPLAPFRPPDQEHHVTHPGLPPPPPKKKKKKELLSASLLPLDKTYLAAGFVFSWVFWTIVAGLFYYWGEKYAVTENSGQVSRPIIVKVTPGQPTQYFQTRALQGSNLSWTRVLDLISMAQETYEKFDFQSLDCQKKALCELQQKQADFGETGRKISNSFSFMDALEGLPMPTIIQTYLKEYKEALLQGKNSTKDCSTIYPKCNFSIKEVFVKYSKKSSKL